MKKFEFLLIEDEESTASETEDLLKECFPRCRIDTATTVDQAITYIQAHRGSYDVVIQDFKLPKTQGVNPEIATELCDFIRRHMQGTVVAHITSFIDDPKVQKNKNEFHSDWQDSPSIMIDKTTSKWASHLIDRIKEYLYGKDIESRIDKLLTGMQGDARDATFRRDTRSYTRSLTLEVAELCRDIATYWDDLDERTRERIQQDICINTNKNPIQVSLL